MCSFMLIRQCCFAIVKVLLKKVTYLLTYLLLNWFAYVRSMFNIRHVHVRVKGRKCLTWLRVLFLLRTSVL